MKLFSHRLLDDLAAKAAASPRLRANHNIHTSPDDRVQRFFIAADRQSYFRPHRHLTRSELAVVLRGRFSVLTFDDNGTVTGRYEIGESAPSIGFETPRATWHTLLATEDGATFLEIKEGPYDPSSAAEFASWAPAESSAGVPELLEWLRNAQPGDVPPKNPPNGNLAGSALHAPPGGSPSRE